MDAARKYLEETGIKYKADQIMEEYGVECVRLPPYHPELNPIGKGWGGKIYPPENMLKRIYEYN